MGFDQRDERRTRRRLLGVCLALMWLAGCAASQGPSPTSTGSTAGAAGDLSLQTVGSVSSGEGDYKIGPLDVLDVSVFDVPDLTKTVRVNASGDISFPLIGNVKAAGKTTNELESDLAGKLGATYLQSPQVSVSVKEYTSQRITVDGSVNKPGIFATTGRTTLLQAVALAQGLDRVADPHAVVVFRTVDGERQAAKFDLAAIRSGAANDPVIYGGDIIVVDQSGGKAALRSVRESIGIFGLFTPLL